LVADARRKGIFPISAATHPASSSKQSTENIPPDCVYSKWQLSSFPNCNTLHELDLSVEFIPIERRATILPKQETCHLRYYGNSSRRPPLFADDSLTN
jgi:hypothetical protein